MKWFGISCGVTALLFSTRVAAQSFPSDEAELQNELRIARSEGLPTSAAEFAATIPSAKPSENAAPIYHRDENKFHFPVDPWMLSQEITFRPSPKTLAEARRLLQTARGLLADLDKAANLPRCWFDWDYSKGPALLFTDLIGMKDGARLLALRCAFAAERGDVRGTLADSRRIFVMAKHAGEPGFTICALVDQNIYATGVRQLASFVFKHPANPEYLDALKQAIKNLPRIDLRRVRRGWLFSDLWWTDRKWTKDEVRELGAGPSEGVPIIAPNAHVARAKAEIVRARLADWAALKLPAAERTLVLNRMQQEIQSAFKTFPASASVYFPMIQTGESEGEETNDLDNAWKLGQVEYAALLRAFNGGRVQRSIKTSDLLSPFNSHPITYSFNGTQLAIGVPDGSEDHPGPRWLKIPPDAMLHN